MQAANLSRSLEKFLFDLLDDLVYPDLNLLLLFLLLLWLFELLDDATLCPQLLLAMQPPSIPLVDETFPLSDELGTDVALFCSILLVELPTVLLKVSADVTLLFLGEERSWSWPPEELLESIKNMLLEFLTTEVPDSITVLDL